MFGARGDRVEGLAASDVLATIGLSFSVPVITALIVRILLGVVNAWRR
jgi:hypothetical protein